MRVGKQLGRGDEFAVEDDAAPAGGGRQKAISSKQRQAERDEELQAPAEPDSDDVEEEGDEEGEEEDEYLWDDVVKVRRAALPSQGASRQTLRP